MLYWIRKDTQNEILNKNKSKTLFYKTQKLCSFILYNVKTINDVKTINGDKKNLDTLNTL